MFDSFKKSDGSVSGGKRRRIGYGLFLVFLIGFFSVGVALMQPSFAFAAETPPGPAGAAKGGAEQAKALCPTTGPQPATCPATGISGFISTVWEGFVAPATKMIAVKALIDFTSFVSNKIAYEAAVYIANGGPGEGSMFYKKSGTEAFKSFGKDVAGQAFADLSGITKGAIGLDLCAPPNPIIRLNLQLSIKNNYATSGLGKPRCDFDSVSKNWKQVAADADALFSNNPFDKDQFLYKKLEQGLKPGTNELGATIGILGLTDERAQKVAEQKFAEYLASIPTGKMQDVKNLVTGETKTPAAIVSDQFTQQLKDAKQDKDKIKAGDVLANPDVWKGLLSMSVSTFTNTLTSTLFNRVYKGLFDPKPDASIDPFNTELAGNTGQIEASKADLGNVFVASIVPNPQYSVIDEFSQCPPDGISNRGLNQCVMDPGVISSITHGDLTVKEVIDQKILNGDWPLISSQNVAANSDRLCYTYGFCYGNLVKMRKARLISIGWELAANSPANKVSNPVTLSQVVNAFTDCNTQGQLDAAHPWCHLIDPNWVIKAPESQCRASANGEIRLSSSVAGRQSVCVDAPTCIGEDSTGKCTQGFGYCVEEKNIWRVRGDSCDAQYATCLTLKNTKSGKEASYLLNTVSNAFCTKQNAGCEWVKTQKYLDSKGTVDKKDDSYEWLPKGDTYTVLDRTDSVQYNAGPLRAEYTYKNGTGANAITLSYSSYSYEDRLYLTHAAKQCDAAQAGCTELNVKTSGLTLNLLQNGSFEKDDDQNEKPDGWVSNLSAGATANTTSGDAIDGKNSLTLDFGTGQQSLDQIISVTPGSFYTLSGYVEAQSTPVASNVYSITAIPLTKDGAKTTTLKGLSISDTCQLGLNDQEVSVKTTNLTSADHWKRFTCTFTLPKDATKLDIRLSFITTNALSHFLFDAIQLESGEFASGITNEYGSATPTKSYLKVAPAYLGCKGLDSDPKECASYAQVCSALDVGCNLYTPSERGPAVPAIASAVDACPNECVGYDTYRQEGTKYESAKFPTYFIADKAAECSSEAVGCDGFTQLGTNGGETQEYFTSLRACLTPDMTGAKTTNVSATYFTWEGSDRTGYQLQTWQLLQSNAPAGTMTFVPSGAKEESQELAPCTKFKTTGNDTEVCDDNALHLTEISKDSTCSSHSDIFNNPDCREFFDSVGGIHYRKYSQTVSVDAACTSYRKDVSTECDCQGTGQSCTGQGTGGYWNPQGFCRYFALPKESNVCAEAENGCRRFTGGAGRNSTTILNETFEKGSYDSFVAPPSGLTLKISNDSVSTGGHSLYGVSAAANTELKTAQEYLAPTNPSLIYIDTDDNTKKASCTGLGTGKDHTVVSGGCQIVNSVTKTTCVVAAGKSSCGPLANSFVKGKTYSLNFWAKGATTLNIKLGMPGTQNKVNFTDKNSVKLTNVWKLYSIGPLDTSKGFDVFDENSQIIFTVVDSGKEFNIDNIELIQGEENITRIKDSWVTPTSCDQTPDGAVSPQYYLGCKGYTDRKGVEGSYYQFTHVCSEKAIGCSAYYNTFNSTSAYAQVSNARCVNLGVVDVPPTTPAGILPDGKAVSVATPCIVNSATYCTIPVNQKYCIFSTSQAFSDPLPLDSGTHFGIVYGPETVVTPQDQSAYLVDNGSATCSSSFKGCREVATPNYEQDQKTVKSFSSKYVMDDPQTYGDILCENKALHCDEFSTSKDGNFYFKNPLDKTCEYKTSVQITGKNFNGWFRSGKSEPCYWTDKSSPLNAKFDPGIDDAYLISGDQSEIWKNGDTNYDGWVGACEASANRCTELIDKTDTSPENHGKGKSYYVINNEKLSEDSVTTTAKCNGLVGQKGGCALFNNTTVSQLKYNSSASYVLSLHADVLLNKHQNDLVDPISCTENGGSFDISEETAKRIGQAGSTSVDLCQRRCAYTLPDPGFSKGDRLITPSAINVGGTNTYFERSCFMNSDCPTLVSKFGKKLVGSCENTQAGYAIHDDANTILKVNRDRTCASWLACNSSRAAWDQGTNTYINICDSINLCTQAGSQADKATCQAWSSRPPVVMTQDVYASRDVSWAGTDFAGYEIPNQLPVERYTQFNLNPKKRCFNDVGAEPATPHVCDSPSDCTNQGAFTTCKEVPPDFRLVYNAGNCNSSDSTNPAGAIPFMGDDRSCKVGVCKTTGTSCAINTDCGTDPTVNPCVFGFCKVLDVTPCASDTECKNVGTQKCDLIEGKCVKTLEGANSAVSCAQNAKFVPASTTITGSCYQDRCLTDIRDGNGDGFLDPLIPSQSDDTQSCRGYPEIDSPFPQKVVLKWKVFIDQKNPVDKAVNPVNGKYVLDFGGTEHAEPFQFISGYDASKVCSPVWDSLSLSYIADDSCLCTYTKAIYAKGSVSRYYPKDVTVDVLPKGICTGGEWDGKQCTSDNACKTTAAGAPDPNGTGTCQLLSSTNTMYGWEGYCLEKDSTIQLNGSTEAKDQACLTWLPVDQLSGATDLYGKDMSAGYPLKNTYYCAETKVYYDLSITAGTSSGYACADAVESDLKTTKQCSDTDSAKHPNIVNDWNADSPWFSIRCPDGYYAIASSCGTDQTLTDGNPVCSEATWDKYPFFCVPLNAFHTTTDSKGVFAEGDACKTPSDSGRHTVGKEGEVYELIVKESKGKYPLTDLYFEYYPIFAKEKAYYNDCKVKGVETMPVWPTQQGYGRSSLVVDVYPACKSVVKVSNTTPNGNPNVAWTNRLWDNAENTYKLSPADSLSYVYKTANPPFGTSIDPMIKNIPTLVDSEPVRVAYCNAGGILSLLPLDGFCSDKKGPIVNEARSFDKFTYSVALTCDTNGAEKLCTPGVATVNDSCKDGKNTGFGFDSIFSTCEKNGGFCDSDKKCQVATKDDSCKDIAPGQKIFELKSTCQLHGGTCEFSPPGTCSSNATISCQSAGDCPPLTGGTGFDSAKAKLRLQQLFAESQHLDVFDTIDSVLGLYKDAVEPDKTTWTWDVRATANGGSTPKPPIITSVGSCMGTSCFEKNDGKFSVNSQDSGTIEGIGSKHMNATFFVHADKNQMPLRNVVVDWGDSQHGLTDVNTKSWPTGLDGSWSGSDAASNFYKNHRGMIPNKQSKSFCDSTLEDSSDKPNVLGFGGAPEACSQSYVLFNHDYVCTTNDTSNVLKNRLCVRDTKDPTRLLNSPCIETVNTGSTSITYCVFQPRIHAKDNWGWCTGFCNSTNSSETTNACFGAECNPSLYPSDGSKIESPLDFSGAKTVNPWVNYEGVIRIKPIQ